jgi:opacity protein-like surface antigen
VIIATWGISSALAQCDCAGCGTGHSSFHRQRPCATTENWFEESCCDTCEPPARCTHYLSAFGGFVDIDNFERKIENFPNTNIDGALHDDDWAYGLTLGRQVHPHGRMEFEFTYRDNGIETWFERQYDEDNILLSNTELPAIGSNRNYTGMVNIVFDLYDRCEWWPGLYLGGGIGGIYMDAEFATAANTYECDDTSFAYQFIGGVNLPVSERIDIFTEFRYLGADYLNVDNLTAGQSLGDFTFDSNNLFFGVRLRR